MAAEFVGGAVFSAFLQVAFDRVASRDVVNFLKGNKGIGGLVEKLKIVMISADSVLSDAEEKQFEYPNVKRWLDELKDAVYVADDLLDEIATEALRSKLEAEFQTSTNKVWGFFSTFANSFDKRIQSDLEKILDRLEFIIKQKDALGLVASVALKDAPGLKAVQSGPLTTSYPEEYGVFGREKDKEAIFEKFQSNGASVDGICVVTIVGMGGVGKTTLARFVFNDKRVKESFDLKAWVCVSENFDSDRIVKTISEAIPNDQNMNSPQNELREKFNGKKIFLVLDDFWNENYCDWAELLRVFKCGAKEIKIIITTRSEKVATNVRTVKEAVSLEKLSDEECWSLFEKHAFINGKAGEFPILEDIGKQIVQKCKGLPLAAKTLGGLLRCKQDPKEWRMILKSEIWNLPKEKSSILSALRLSYHYLPSHLKHCFAYCSILPKDYEFKKEELVLLWMSQD